jgi:hypothetical protein
VSNGTPRIGEGWLLRGEFLHVLTNQTGVPQTVAYGHNRSERAESCGGWV